MLTVKPRNEWVLIRRDKRGEQVLDSGVVIPEDQKRSTTGTVLSFGRKVEDLNVGDRVVFTNFAMDVEGLPEEFALVREEEVYGLLGEEQALVTAA